MTSETVGYTFVLDASALLAYLGDEPGSETVQTILTDQAVMTADRAWATLDFGARISMIRQ